MNQKIFCFKCQKFKGKEIEDTKSFQGRVWEKTVHTKQNKQTTQELGWHQTSYLENFK